MIILLALNVGIVHATSFSGGTSEDGQALGLDGKGDKIVVPKCGEISTWLMCSNIDNAPPDVIEGFDYAHNTTNTIGPNGNIKNPDGSTIFVSPNACTSCHFGSSQTPGGNPLYQSPDKYTSLPYFRSFNYRRDLRDSINDCIKNCGGGNPIDKNSEVMNKLVAYINWVRDGVTDPDMKTATGWRNMPGEAMPVVDPNWKTMAANASRGATLYKDKGCRSCNDADGPGKGKLRSDEGRPRVPSLWGSRAWTMGAAYIQTPNLAGVIKNHMPFGKPGSLTVQQALDIAGYINMQNRPAAFSGTMFCENDPATGLPNTLFKPAAWWSGCSYPNEPFTKTQRILGPWAPIENWRNAKIQCLKAETCGF
jgi:cytochrome c